MAFSPDGHKLAVGFDDTAAVNVLDGHDLKPLDAPDTSGVNNGNLVTVAWSRDGTMLYAGGRYHDVNGSCLILAWDEAGRGTRRALPAARNTLLDFRPLQGGGLAYGATDALGVLNAEGRPRWRRQPDQADFRNNWGGFLLSADGLRVQFGYALGGKRPARFSVREATLTLGLLTDSTLHPPRLKAPGLEISDWKNTYSPKLNGRPLALAHYEMARSLAIAPDGERFLLGTEWSLRLFDQAGREQWEVAVPGVAYRVNIAANGKLAVAALRDGTIRWYRLADGRELLALFPHADGKRWVAWTPSGYFMASPGGEALIGWHLNHGKDQSPDLFPVGQFRARYYRPEVVEQVLVTLDEAEAVKRAEAEGGPKPAAGELREQLPPVITLLAPEEGASITQSPVTVRYRARSPSGEPVTAVKALIDGRPLPGARTLERVKLEAEQTLAVEVPAHDVELALIAENRFGASEPARVHLHWAGQAPEGFVIKPKLYVLAVGVSHYARPELHLDYPAKDAQDFSAALKRQEGGLYREVAVKLIADAGRAAVVDGLEWLEHETTSQDVAMMFLAGHGEDDRNGNYYFLPQDADPDHLKATAVAYTDIKNTLEGLPGKVLLFVDTCHAGDVMGGRRRGGVDIDRVVMDLTSAENGAVVFASSTGHQYALEDRDWGNGAFTKALVEGLDGQADYDGKGRITVNMLGHWLSERVKAITDGRQTPTTRMPDTVPDFPVAVRR